MNMEGDKPSEGSCDNIIYIHIKFPIKYQNNFDDVQFCVNNIKPNAHLNKFQIVKCWSILTLLLPLGSIWPHSRFNVCKYIILFTYLFIFCFRFNDFS